MITNDKLVKRADAFAKGHKTADLPAGLASQVAVYQAMRKSGTDLAVHAHAKSLVQLVDALGLDDEPKAPAKKAATGRRRKR